MPFPMMLGSKDTACVVHDALADFDVSERILTALPPFTGARAVMVYGSQARGDATEDSTQERRTAGSGTLFGA